MCHFFFWFFSSLVLTTATLVITSKNPVYSVLFLILSFCNLSALLFLLNLEFLPVSFLVVYVGAIAVLFLFVVMMLNIKLSEIKSQEVSFLAVGFVLSSTFICEVLVLFNLDFLPLSTTLGQSDFISDFTSRSFFFVNTQLFHSIETNLRSIGQTLFVEFWVQFLIAGYVLLLAMVAAIILTLNKTFFSKTQNVYFQVLRDFESCVILYK